MVGPSRFCFLSVESEVDGAMAWQGGQDMLWLYNLHYFDDLNAEEAEARADWHRAWINRWIDENPPASGVGWDPYPTSLRIVNWVKWMLAGHSPPPRLLHSLAMQARSLAGRIEFHLLGNHLFVNAKALLFAGLFFDGSEAETWRRRASELLLRELDEQVLADGGHFERSPMYHALILEDVLDVLNLTTAFGCDPDELTRRCRRKAEQMLDFLRAIIHPDGELSFFNDTALAIAPAPTALFAYAARLGLVVAPAQPLALIEKPDSGYWVFGDENSRAIVDAGPIGPDYLPGHAHCDTLSYELSVGDRRVIVNSGVYTYQGVERHWFRSTAAHNTLRIDGEEQHEIWGQFRVARRGRVVDVHTSGTGTAIALSAAHTGYRRLPGNPTHRRTIRHQDSVWTIEDRIEGGGTHRVESYVHLHPEVIVVEASDRAVVCRTGDVMLRIETEGVISCEDTYYSPTFGARDKNQTLVLRKNGQLPLILSYTITVGSNRGAH